MDLSIAELNITRVRATQVCWYRLPSTGMMWSAFMRIWSLDNVAAGDTVHHELPLSRVKDAGIPLGAANSEPMAVPELQEIRNRQFIYDSGQRRAPQFDGLKVQDPSSNSTNSSTTGSVYVGEDERSIC